MLALTMYARAEGSEILGQRPYASDIGQGAQGANRIGPLGDAKLPDIQADLILRCIHVASCL